jgi:hypothetical protein
VNLILAEKNCREETGDAGIEQSLEALYFATCVGIATVLFMILGLRVRLFRVTSAVV